MAPEILERNSKDRSYDETTDVYAFGIALWEMLTCLDVRLHPPPSASSIAAITHYGSHTGTPPPRLQDHVSAASGDSSQRSTSHSR